MEFAKARRMGGLSASGVSLVGTRRCKRRTIVVDIRPSIDRPKSNIECKGQRGPKHFRLDKFTASHSFFSAGCQCLFPFEVECEAKTEIDEDEYEQNAQEPGDDFVKWFRHRMLTSCRWRS